MRCYRDGKCSGSNSKNNSNHKKKKMEKKEKKEKKKEKKKTNIIHSIASTTMEIEERMRGTDSKDRQI